MDFVGKEERIQEGPPFGMAEEGSVIDLDDHPPSHPNADYFGTGEPILMEPTVTEPMEPISFDADDDSDKAGPQSSFENIIPLQNLRHGFAVVTEAVGHTANIVQEKATEVYQSEPFQNARRKTAEVITPAWQRTCDAAVPVWEQTKISASVAAERTREVTAPVWEQTRVTAAVAAERTQEAAQRMRPAMQQFGRQVSEATISSWRFLSAAALSAADYTQRMATEVLGDDESNPNNASNIPPPETGSSEPSSKPTVV